MTDEPAVPAVGDVLTVDIGAVAHGGHCVARRDGDGLVLFVRHALPGERVRAQVTELGGGGRFVRADAVEVLTPSPDRVEAPCPYAGPGLCGGCDWQHADLAAHQPKFSVVTLIGDDTFASLTWNAHRITTGERLCGIEIFKTEAGIITDVWNSGYFEGEWS